MANTLLQTRWKDYLFLTVEMQKFLGKNDLKMFFNLVKQREKIQSELEKISNKAYQESPEGKKILLQIQQANMELMNQFRLAFNNMKRRKNISHAYEAVVIAPGSFINQKT